MHDLQREVSIYEVDFGYNAILDVYPNSSSHILKLCEILSRTDFNRKEPVKLNIERIHLISMKVRDAIKLIESDGWYLVKSKGSHKQFNHPSKKGRVTIAGHPNHDLAPGTMNSILKQAQVKP